MGFSKAALYYHFASKSDILLGLHERMHGAIDDLLPELEKGVNNPGAWEAFLGSCIDRMLANRKLFLMHRVNQAAFEQVHSRAHAEQHIDLEEGARKLFSDTSVPAVNAHLWPPPSPPCLLRRCWPGACSPKASSTT
jgi:AcrR family transcriptional regulator